MIERTVQRVAQATLAFPPIMRLGAAAAAARRRSLVLLFHRVVEDAAASTAVVPTVPTRVVRAQIAELMRIGSIVPLASLLERRRVGRRPRFALTFDDDLMSHHEVAAPLLRELGVPATFFLGGRALVGLGPPWFEILDAWIRERGAPATASRLGIAGTAAEIAALCERDPDLQRVIEEQADLAPRQLGSAEIRALADAGMAIGFHTVRHRVLTALPDVDIDIAAREGRTQLEDIVGPTRLFAYPHGRVDRRTSERIRLAGYDAAWTGRPRAVRPRDETFALGRWEPGNLVGSGFTAKVVAMMNGVAGR